MVILTSTKVVMPIFTINCIDLESLNVISEIPDTINLELCKHLNVEEIKEQKRAGDEIFTVTYRCTNCGMVSNKQLSEPTK